MSGKTTWVNSVHQAGDLVVDMDSIWQCVSGLNRFQKPMALNAVVFGVRDYLIDSVRMRRGKWNNAYVIGGYPLISGSIHLDIQRRVPAAPGAGRQQGQSGMDALH